MAERTAVHLQKLVDPVPRIELELGADHPAVPEHHEQLIEPAQRLCDLGEGDEDAGRAVAELLRVHPHTPAGQPGAGDAVTVLEAVDEHVGARRAWEKLLKHHRVPGLDTRREPALGLVGESERRDPSVRTPC